MARRAAGPRRRTAQQRAGDDAEAWAAAWYTAAGCVVVAQNVVIASAELDLVVDDHGVIAFVEVRKRKSRQEALESISPRKRRILVRGASAWLAWHAPTAFARFDVATVMDQDVEVVKNAFNADDA